MWGGQFWVKMKNYNINREVVLRSENLKRKMWVTNFFLVCPREGAERMPWSAHIFQKAWEPNPLPPEWHHFKPRIRGLPPRPNPSVQTTDVNSFQKQNIAEKKKYVNWVPSYMLTYLFLIHLHIWFIIMKASIYGVLCSRNCSTCFLRIFSEQPSLRFPHFIQEERGAQRG